MTNIVSHVRVVEVNRCNLHLDQTKITASVSSVIKAVYAKVSIGAGGATPSVFKFEAAESINSHVPVALVGGKLYKYDNTVELHRWSFVGFTKTSASVGDMVEVERELIVLSGWGLMPNMAYMAGTGGSMQVVNVGSGFTKVIGWAVDANTMMVNREYTAVSK